MPTFTVIDGGASPAERAQATAIQDQYYFGPPPHLRAGLHHALIGAVCGLVSLGIFFVVTNDPTSRVADHWPVFVVIGAVIGWFLRFDPNRDH